MARLHDGRSRGPTVEPFSTEPVTLIEEVFPQDTNAYDTLFGGRLLSLMDKAGGIACAQFAHDFRTGETRSPVRLPRAKLELGNQRLLQ